MMNRRGGGSFGCLVTLVILGIVGWIGVRAATVYVRAYRYEDVLRRGLQFANTEADSTIQRKVRAAMDSIAGLPAEAYGIVLERRTSGITIAGGYEDTIRIPFRPRAVRHDFVIERGP